MKQDIQTELSIIVYDWLIKIGNRIDREFCKYEIATHSDYPSILSVVDFLDSGKMNYHAVQADSTFIKEFNYPLLAHIKKPGNEYLHIIPNRDAWEAQRETTKYWSGVTIYPEKNSNWQNVENDEAIKAASKRQFLFIIWCCIGVLIFAVSVYFRLDIWYNLIGLLSLFGVFISTAAFAVELGIQSNSVKQVCGSVSKGGCETVLKSKLAEGIFGVTLSDAAVIYFTAQFIVYSFSCIFTSLFNSLPFFALIGILVVGVSIYTQAVVIKNWCALCLGIATVLFLQFLVSILTLSSFYLASFVIFVLSILLCIAILLTIKTILKASSAAKPRLLELKKWQADTGLFLAQLDKEQKVDTTMWENDLVLGDQSAPVLITIACNPYCGPCATTHKELDKTLQKFKGKVKVQLRLLGNPSDDEDKKSIAIRAILKQAKLIKSNSELQSMLSDWFEWMDFERWSNKWIAKKSMTSLHSNDTSPEDILDIAQEVNLHNSWITESNITYTPTIFFNGKKLPNRYDLKMVEKFIPNLSEEICV